MRYLARMATFTHASVTISGGFNTGTYWDEEIAQVGFRVACWPKVTTPSVDAPLPIRECSIVYQEVNEADVTGVAGWYGETEYWSLEDQLSVVAACTAWINGVRTQQSSSFSWTSIKIAPIGPDGHNAASSSFFTYRTPIAGASAGAMLPPQLSICTTFKAAVPGRRGRGRMYLPALQQGTNGTSGTVASSARTALGNAGRKLIDDINAISIGTRYELVVTSAQNPRYVLPQQVRVGDQFDTQRRRRGGVRESFTNF